MKLLLDSHTLIWSADDPGKVPASAMTSMQDPANERLVSAASLWEIAIKVGKGKLPLALPYRAWMDKAIRDLGLVILPITLDHAERLVGLPLHHLDPFDRLLASQAIGWPTHVDGTEAGYCTSLLPVARTDQTGMDDLLARCDLAPTPASVCEPAPGNSVGIFSFRCRLQTLH